MSAEALGVEATLAVIGNNIADFEARVDSLIQYAGQEAEEIAIDKAAVDTGLMRASIAYTPGRMFSEVHCYVYYSVFVDRGTSRMSAQPFMTPAYDVASENLKAGIQAL